MISSKASRRAPLLFTILLLSAATLAAGPGWVRLGPEGAGATGLAAGPAGSGVLLAGVNRGGFYRSGDFGATWSLWAPQLGAANVEWMQGAPDGQHLLAALGAGLGFGTSDDGGWTWLGLAVPDIPPPWGDTPWVDGIVQAPSNPSVLYLTMETLAAGGGDRTVLYRSADRGATWVEVTPSGGTSFTNIQVSATDPNEIVGRNGNNELQQSRDGGLTWTALLYQGAPVHPISAVFQGVAFSPSRSGWMYVLLSSGPLLRSTDHGATWEELPTEPDHASHYYGLPLIVEDGGVEVLYACASGGLLRVAGTQSTWLPSPRPEAFRILAADPSDPHRLVAATGSGIFRSSDSGGTWIESTSGMNATVLDLVFPGPSGSPALFASDGRALFARDASGSWTRALSFDTSAVYAPTLAAAAPRGVIYLAARTAVALSTDGGASWEDRSTGLPGGGTPQILGLAVNQQHAGDAWAATTSGLFRTLDGGLHWDEVDTGDPAFPVSVAVDPDHPGHVVVGLRENPETPWVNAVPVVLRSTDAGATWQRGALISSVEALSFAFPRGSSVVLAATAAGVFRSADGGLSWSPSSEGMDIRCEWTPGGPDLPEDYRCTDFAGGIVRDPVRAATVYASTERGVWRSSDAGASWTLLEPVLGPWGPYAISVAPDGSRLYAATPGSGVLALDLAAYQPPPQERTVRRRVGRTR